LIIKLGRVVFTAGNDEKEGDKMARRCEEEEQ
jgi:hypothetical protein